MKDVAMRVGVSVQSISGIAINSPAMVLKTRERVLRAKTPIGYRPYLVVPTLRPRVNHTSAFIASHGPNLAFSAVASAAEDDAHMAGYGVAVHDTHDDVAHRADASTRDTYIKISIQEQSSG
jgi:DNA-binding LacI/PurR family transcriptional regulator